MKQKGQSLMEVLVAAFTLGVLVTIVVGVFSYASLQHRRDTAELQALSFAKTVEEYLRSLRYEDPPLAFERPALPPGCDNIVVGENPAMTCALKSWDNPNLDGLAQNLQLPQAFIANYDEFMRRYHATLRYEVLGVDAEYRPPEPPRIMPSPGDRDRTTFDLRMINVFIDWEPPHG